MDQSGKKPPQVSKAPPPITPLRGGSASAVFRSASATKPDWKFWLLMPNVKLWQACALSLDIDPDSMKRDPYGRMAGGSGGPFFESGTFRDQAEETTFYKRLRLLVANFGRPHFSLGVLNMANVNLHEVWLAEFAAWAQSIGWQIPKKLTTVARAPEGPEIRGKSADTRRQAAGNRTRLDAIGTEIKEAVRELSSDATSDEVMHKLKSYAGKSGSCITQATSDGVLWRSASRDNMKLTMGALRKRLARLNDSGR